VDETAVERRPRLTRLLDRDELCATTMNAPRASRSQSQKPRKPSVAPQSPKCPPVKLSGWEVALHSLLQKVTPQDLALVAAGLSKGRPINEKVATRLINEACMLLGMAGSRLVFLPSQTTGMVAPPAAPPREISGAALLRKAFPSNGPGFVERRREFARRVMQFLEQHGAGGVLRRFQTTAELDDWLAYFKTLKLPSKLAETFDSIVAQIKESPEAQQRRTRARQKGGLRRAAQQLGIYLRDNGGVAHVETLIRDRRHRQDRLEAVIEASPQDFEKFEYKGLPAVRLRKSKKLHKDT
jgi:hypothetical protein